MSNDDFTENDYAQALIAQSLHIDIGDRSVLSEEAMAKLLLGLGA